MSEAIEALVLGLIQGLTEFLPVSSSGHLELAKFLLGDDRVGEQSLLFTVILHLATALATLVVFRREVKSLLLGAIQPQGTDRQYLLFIFISMIPAAVVGLFFEDAIALLFNRQILLVGCALIATGILLFLADRKYRAQKRLSATNAFIIGVAQAIAILPGISRSGATIATAVLLKVEREEAARFSFLMVVPLILGKVAKDILTGDLSLDQATGTLLLGFSAAFFAGLVACTWMISLVKRARLKYFGFYCLLVGLLAVATQFA